MQQITVFLAACTLGVLVVASAQEDSNRVLLSKLRNLAARVAGGDVPDLYADDDYKRGGKKSRGIYKNSGINFGKRQDSESGEASRNTKRMRYHKGISFGKRAQVPSWNLWRDEETYNPDWDLGQFD